jgi:NTP pyrophosphatase (non-canonical NTP hydrolase)
MSPASPGDRQLRTFSGLRRVVATLRGPDGCPWDRVQTHESLRPYLTEEAAEVLAALDEGEVQKFCEELGDLLFQVLIHVQLAEERGEFKMSDVIYALASKLVRRHPHVFAAAVADTPDAVVEQWDDLKRRERGSGPGRRSARSSVARLCAGNSAPRSACRFRVGERTAGLGGPGRGTGRVARGRDTGRQTRRAGRRSLRAREPGPSPGC